MKAKDAKRRIDEIQATIDSRNYENMLDNRVAAGDSCNELRKLCRNLRLAIKRSGCGGREADPLLCQPMWDELNDAYAALSDCMAASRKK